MKPRSNSGRKVSDTDNFCPTCGKPFPAIVGVPKGMIGADTVSLPVADRAAISKFRLFTLLSIFPFALEVPFNFVGALPTLRLSWGA
ncbi:MAG: hypothetical protein E6K99_08455 [Thaumarchaeota archaeon]|nr:MAG: hypothetical protein E6K99_08455 [Nitrososphaerota archaeon]